MENNQTNPVEENLLKITNAIKQGNLREAKPQNVQQNAEIQKLFREHLALHGQKEKMNPSLFQFNSNELNNRINVLARQLNGKFANSHAVNEILDNFNFEDNLKETLSDMDYFVYEKEIKNKFPANKVKEFFEKTGNILQVRALLNGYDNAFEYHEHLAKERKKLNDMSKAEREKEQRINEMAEAIRRSAVK